MCMHRRMRQSWILKPITKCSTLHKAKKFITCSFAFLQLFPIKMKRWLLLYNKPKPAMNRLKEGEDYYFNEEGLMVLTEKFHLKKGFCCGNGCKHCPYEYKNVPEPRRTELLAKKIKPADNIRFGDL